MKQSQKRVLQELQKKIIEFYGDRLISLIIYGSYARGTATSQSDLDLLLIVKKLPKRKMKRIEEFINNVENKLQVSSYYISPVIKTQEEASQGSPLFFDMVYDVIILYDREEFFQNILESLRKRFKELGSQRIWRGNRWYWILKPDIQPGEVFEI